MTTTFNAEAFLNDATCMRRINGISFHVRDAAAQLRDNPALGSANSDVTGIFWSTQAISEDDAKPCLVGRAVSGNVAVVIYTEDHFVMAASEKEIPDDIREALGDMLQCLHAGNAPWIRVDESTFGAAFDILFAEAPKVAFQKAWDNGTGYLDGACLASVDGIKSFFDGFGRRAILIPCLKEGMAHKSVVVFERYANNDDSPLVFNAPPVYTSATSGLAYNIAHLHQLLLEAANIKVVSG